MPYFTIETNKKIDNGHANKIIKNISRFLSNLLGKDEKLFMISIKPGTQMLYGGSPDPLLAFVELKSIGLSKEQASKYSLPICEFIESEIGIRADRIYVDFTDIDPSMFAWNKATF